MLPFVTRYDSVIVLTAWTFVLSLWFAALPSDGHTTERALDEPRVIGGSEMGRFFPDKGQGKWCSDYHEGAHYPCGNKGQYTRYTTSLQ